MNLLPAASTIPSLVVLIASIDSMVIMAAVRKSKTELQRKVIPVLLFINLKLGNPGVKSLEKGLD